MKRLILAFVTIISTLLPNEAWAQRARVWVALDGVSGAGTPIQATVRDVSVTGTTMELVVPGFWQEPVSYGGRTFTKITMPPVELGGVGFPQKAGERGWYDFPPETGMPPLPTARFQEAILIGLTKPIYPQGQLGAKPKTGAEMQRLGIDPAGARPGIPMLRGFAAVSRANLKGDIDLTLGATETKSFQLPQPLAPAGYEALDIIPQKEGYIAPELVDEEFYANFRGAYKGTEAPITEVSGAGAGFAAIETRVPLVEVTTPGLIKVLSRTTILLKHLKGTEDFECPITWDAWINLFPFINGAALRESFTKKGLSIQSSRSAHYLIITPRNYRSALNEFALWKQAKGLNVDFAYVGAAAGDDVAADRTAIDTYLENYFKQNYCHGVYVLLVGDVDVIPSGGSTRVVASPDANNADSDHVYEVLGSDRFPSMYVGRLSVNTEADLKWQLSKILAYEKNPPNGDWPTRATLAANSENDDGTQGVSSSFPSKYAAAVNSISSYGGYTVPPTFQVLHAGAASTATTRAVNADVVNAIQQGRGQVLYRGHGNGSSWVSGWDGSSSSGAAFSTTQVNGLSNSITPIVFSIACQNARLLVSDSIGETWMTTPKGGAVAHYGASVNSYTSENHERAKGIYRAFYESGFTRLGPAIAEAERISHNATGGGDSWDNNTFCYNLLGDPEMTVRKKTVNRFKLLADITKITTGALLTVRDDQGGIPPGTFVKVTLANGSSTNGFVNTRGELAVPNIDPAAIAFVDMQADGYDASRVTNEKRERQWVPFEPNALPGAPVTVVVGEQTQTNTSLTLKIPGVWVHTTVYGGREVSTIEFPGLDKLVAPGIPQKAGERGWYDFPEDSGVPTLPVERYQHPFEKGVYQPVFPESALGKAPTTAREMIALGIDPAGARPMIPTLRGFLAVARATTDKELEVDLSNSVLKQVQLPAPLKPAGFTGSDQIAAPRFGYNAPELFDEEFYSSFKGIYRGVEKPVSKEGSKGSFGVAEVAIPLAEATSAASLNVYTEIKVLLKHLKGTEDFECPFSWDSWLFHLPFINGAAIREAMTTKGIRIEGSRSAHYLIMTPQEYREELDEFAKWKQKKGLNVDFAYLGTDVTADRNAIDTYIENYFKQNYCHGVYVLLVGDVDVLPGGRSNRIDSNPDRADADADHVYEVLGSDRFPSLYVGRLSVNSAQELNTQLAKILAYERSPAGGSWPRRATLAANSENSDGTRGVSSSFPSKYAQAVNQTANYGSYTITPTFEVLHAGAANSQATRAVNQDVIDSLNEGVGIVAYRGHGGGSSWVAGWDGSSTSGTEFSAGTHVMSLANNVHPIVFSIACQNARLRNNDSIAEVWLNQANGGAVAHFGASVNSYTSENHERFKGLFRAIWANGFTRLGPSIAEGESLSYTATGGGGGWDNNTFCYNLLGDPEMTIRKQSILLQVPINPVITAVSTGLVVTLRDQAGNPVRGALVNVVLANEVRTNRFSSEAGTLTLAGIKASEVKALQIHADGYEYNETDFSEIAPPRLTGIGFLRGSFQMEVNSAGGKWIIQGSLDLRSWQDLGTVESGKQLFSDPNSFELGHRYYRAVESR